MPDEAKSNGDDARDEVRRGFKEALERKQANAQTGAAHRDANSKVHDAHGPVGGKREFRRKSG